ncbi:hypothetical protein PYL72_16435, partial [Paenibacillus larvae subsp. larvae]
TNHGDTVSATTFFVFYTVYLTGVSSLQAEGFFEKKINHSSSYVCGHGSQIGWLSKFCLFTIFNTKDLFIDQARLFGIVICW